MLPQGMFSVAVATVLFPTLSRQAAQRDASGMRRALAIGTRQINLLLIPASAFLMVLSTPVVRLIYQHGQFNATRPTTPRSRSSGSPSACPSGA